MKETFFFHSDLKVVLVVVVWTSLKCFTFFLLGLNDFVNSVIFFFFFLSIFQKICKMSKNVVSKNKANYKLMLLVHKDKNCQKIIKINIAKLFI